MKTIQRREPFFGEASDRELLGPGFVSSMGDGSEEDRTSPFLPEQEARELIQSMGYEARRAMAGAAAAPRTQPHPDYCEKGTELPLGFIPHRGENRQQRRAGVATWAPPKADQPKAEAGAGAGGEEPGTRPGGEPPPAPMPTRRELWKQRQRQRRGKLDPELRRLQRRKAKQHGT